MLKRPSDAPIDIITRKILQVGTYRNQNIARVGDSYLKRFSMQGEICVMFIYIFGDRLTHVILQEAGPILEGVYTFPEPFITNDISEWI